MCTPTPEKTGENNPVLQHPGRTANFLLTPAVPKGKEIISKFDETKGRENNKDTELAK